MNDVPDYFDQYENFVLDRSATGVLTVRFHTDGAEHTFTGTTHHGFPRLVEEIAYDRDNKVLVLTGTGNTFIDSIDGPSLGDITKPWTADVMYLEGRPHLAFGVAPGDGLFVVWEEVLGLNRARFLELTRGSFTAQDALAWGAVGEVVPQQEVLSRAQRLAEQMTTRPQLTNRYIALVFRQRISRRLTEGMALGMALESLTAANLAYASQG